ncbi:Uncharacterized protein Adt_03078 [Abeliophyllum distichum]|uniref:Retrotransposon gag domain-containing protein n=1 Tax=Abeliophyllum distichum TaxID=126358 RepID=A0ABD1VXH9_9LAMI
MGRSHDSRVRSHRRTRSQHVDLLIVGNKEKLQIKREYPKESYSTEEAKQKNILEEYTTDRHSPFLENILAKPLAEKLKMPQLTSYDDGNNLVGHLDRYTSWMELQGASDAIMCRAFPLMFENRAMRWFRKLPQRSIRSCNDLSSQFVSTFMGQELDLLPKNIW